MPQPATQEQKQQDGNQTQGEEKRKSVSPRGLDELQISGVTMRAIVESIGGTQSLSESEEKEKRDSA
jgi:hypothetical protein